MPFSEIIRGSEDKRKLPKIEFADADRAILLSSYIQNIEGSQAVGKVRTAVQTKMLTDAMENFKTATPEVELFVSKHLGTVFAAWFAFVAKKDQYNLGQFFDDYANDPSRVLADMGKSGVLCLPNKNGAPTSFDTFDGYLMALAKRSDDPSALEADFAADEVYVSNIVHEVKEEGEKVMKLPEALS